MGAQLCRDLLPEPHFKRFSWMELTVMLVSSFCLLYIKVLDSHKCIPKMKGWGNLQELAVDLTGQGWIWEYKYML